MAEIKFEGDLSSINDTQLDFIKSALNELGYRDGTVKVEPVGIAGDNYVATVKRFTIEKDGEQFKVFGKIAPSNEMMRAIAHLTISFHNENAMYNNIIPKLDEIQQAVPDEEKYKFLKCYGSNQEEPNEVILLEDLKELGYSMLDRSKSLSDECVRLVLKKLAVYHALSFALKQQDPEAFEQLKSKLINPWDMMAESGAMRGFLEGVEGMTMMLLDDKYKGAVKGVVVNVFDTAKEIYIEDKESTFTVIHQGDSWVNNIMFKMEDENPIDCIIVDYQQAKESSPVADIYYMIYTCTDYAQRSNHYQVWIEHYHSELQKALKYHHLDVQRVYPRKQMDDDLKRHGRLSLGLSILMASVVLRQSAEAAKLKATMEEQGLEAAIESAAAQGYGMDATVMAKYKERVEGLVESHQELGYV